MMYLFVFIYFISTYNFFSSNISYENVEQICLICYMTPESPNKFVDEDFMRNFYNMKEEQILSGCDRYVCIKCFVRNVFEMIITYLEDKYTKSAINNYKIKYSKDVCEFLEWFKYQENEINLRMLDGTVITREDFDPLKAIKDRYLIDLKKIYHSKSDEVPEFVDKNIDFPDKNTDFSDKNTDSPDKNKNNCCFISCCSTCFNAILSFFGC